MNLHDAPRVCSNDFRLWGEAWDMMSLNNGEAPGAR